jgi:phage terminase large subunit-like protein
MVDMDETLREFCHVIPSQKKIIGLPLNVEYKALSADGSKNMGLSPILAILDEVGQVVGPTDYFTDSITSAQGAHDNPLMIAISTQAPSDADMFSIWIDDALRNPDGHIVCHIYRADKDAVLDDPAQLAKANPAIGRFLNQEYVIQEMQRAARIPSEEAKARNLHLNQRISLVNAWLAPSIWNENSAGYDVEVMREQGVHLGLDLSKKNDLTAAVFSSEDPNDKTIHMYPVCFTPLGGIEERSRRDRVPYDQWVRDGVIIGVPGDTLSYDWLAEYLKIHCDDLGLEILSVQFDRWRITEMQASATRTGFALDAEWVEVGQGFVSMSPRVENFETLLLERRIRHGRHPVLNMGAASAIRIYDASGNSKLDKSKSSQKIDALVAAVMSVYPFANTAEEAFDAASLIG